MEKTSDNECCLKNSHPYYAQIQGQMGVWQEQSGCDFILYTNVGLYIQRIPLDFCYWSELKDKVYTYYFKKFIQFAAVEVCKTKTLQDIPKTTIHV